MYLFDRQTGNFIREIGKVGRGPGEYQSVGFFNSETQHLITNGNGRDLYEYDLDGNIIRKISRPQKEVITRQDGIFSDAWWLNENACAFLDNNSMVYYNHNIIGDARDRLLIADEKGIVHKIFNNTNSFIRQGTGIAMIPPIFYRHDSNILFFENCVDTIYRVTKDTLFFHFHLKVGKYKPPYEKRNDIKSMIEHYFWFNRIGESNRFLFFDFSYQRKFGDPYYISYFGYYDKTEKIVMVADVNRDERQIRNDIDNFSAVQLSNWTINECDNELISYIEAEDMVEWFENNPRKVKELPEHLQKLSKVKPEDNPVVIITKLK